MRLCILPNFLSQEGCSVLSSIADSGVKEGWVTPGLASVQGGLTHLRLTSRFYGSRVKLPKEISTVEARIVESCRLEGKSRVVGHGTGGVVVSITYEGGSVHKHKDPSSSNGLATLRCNILTRKPEKGGFLYLEGNLVKVNQGDLHCYLASEHEHYVSEVYGPVSRVLWMFGAHVAADDWNNNRIGPPDAV